MLDSLEDLKWSLGTSEKRFGYCYIVRINYAIIKMKKTEITEMEQCERFVVS